MYGYVVGVLVMWVGWCCGGCGDGGWFYVYVYWVCGEVDVVVVVG